MDGIIDSMDMSLSKLQEIVKNREDWHASVHGVAELDTALVTEQQLQGNLLHHPFLGPSHQHLLCIGVILPTKAQG